MVISFQFTHPGKGATVCICLFGDNVAFQFTHPGKGATATVIALNIISLLFQFTHPGKGATVHAFGGVFSIGFQFTHPGKGATKAQHTDSRALRVSIHAPWEGCDSAGGAVARPLSSFNSRTLGRVRHLRHLIILLFHLFQFTHPGKGATKFTTTFIAVRIMFQFTHPGKGATSQVSRLLPEFRVSIHAPWEGCDFAKSVDFVPGTEFQFTHPGKGATALSLNSSTIRGSFNSRTLGRVRLG